MFSETIDIRVFGKNRFNADVLRFEDYRVVISGEEDFV